MIEMNFKPKSARKSEPDPDSTEDEPIPTYEEWLDEGAEAIFAHPGFAMAKGAIEFIKYLWTRERLLISLLIQKDIIHEHEVKEYFGDDAHKAVEKEGVKQLTTYMLRAASKGQLTGPSGKTLDPDGVLVLLNDVLDLNGTGWNGRTVEIMSDMMGDKDLRSDYDKEVSLLKKLNEKRAAERERLAKNQTRFEAELERQKDLEVQHAQQRKHRLKIYISQCRVADKPTPSDEEQKQMLEGEIPIPKVA